MDLPLETAALQLAITAVALRARCRRNARREKGEVVARLGGGIVAYKFGSHWRVRFPPELAPFRSPPSAPEATPTQSPKAEMT